MILMSEITQAKLCVWLSGIFDSKPWTARAFREIDYNLRVFRYSNLECALIQKNIEIVIKDHDRRIEERRQEVQDNELD